MSIKEHPPQLHVPVLLEVTLRELNPKDGETYLDLTAGYGGHAREILQKTNNFTQSTLVDRDDYAIGHITAEFQDRGVRIMHTDFLTAARQLVEEGKQYDVILADLGVSSPQLDQAERGFSFMQNGPLDMRMDRSQQLSAEVIVNTFQTGELTDIIYRYGEETYTRASKIAQAIVSTRPIQDTETLRKVIEVTVGRTSKKIHQATRTFQALRIAVNEELRQVEELLPLLPKLLKSGGRVGIISFHSLEDRLVKRYFKQQHTSGYESELQLVTKKPLDGATYDVHNPRSRSSKLRVAVKT